MYKIPLFDLNYDEKEERAVLDVLRTKWISSGPKCMELEHKMKETFNVKFALAVANCTAALHLAMLASGVGPGDEVLVPSLTFVATVNAVRYVGATPLFCDVTSLSLPVIDPTRIEERITDKTKAIIVMHFGGFPCDMDEIMAIAEKHGLKVIEDACHGPLSEYRGKKLGTIGDIGCFSFFSNKNISTGEGGAIITNDENLYEKMKSLRSHGMTTMSYERSTGHAVEYDVTDLGYNYRLDDIRASLAIVQFDKLDADISRRSHVRNLYLNYLEGAKGIILPFERHTERSSSYIFPVVLGEQDSWKYNDGCERRNLIRNELANAGIQTSVHYPAAHRFQIYKEYNTDSLPMTEYISDHEISLPMYGRLQDDEIRHISNELIRIISATA